MKAAMRVGDAIRAGLGDVNVLGVNAGVDGKVAGIHGTMVTARPKKAVTRIKLAVREDVG
jgi:hypothetical protein